MLDLGGTANVYLRPFKKSFSSDLLLLMNSLTTKPINSHQ
jgi:hypothetical protein